MKYKLYNTFGIPCEVLQPEAATFTEALNVIDKLVASHPDDKELFVELGTAVLVKKFAAGAPGCSLLNGSSFAANLTDVEHARAASWLAENHPKHLTEAARGTLRNELTGHFVRGLAKLSPQDADVALKAITSLA